MLQYGPLRPRAPWAGSPPTAFIDTSVLHEFWSIEDLSRAVDACVLMGVSAEPRRLRARGTYWMAMALDDLGAATLCLEDETLPLVLRNLKGDPMREGWHTLMVHFVRPEICAAWTHLNLDDDIRGHDYNDTIIANDAVRRGIPIVTRDQDVVRKARAGAGTTMKPEEFAASVLPLREARRRFFDRYDDRAAPWALQTDSEGKIDWILTKRQCDALSWWRIRLEYIWSDEPDRFLLNTFRGEIIL